MPSMSSEKVESLVLAIDTSGSIGTKELTAVLSEVQGIAEEVTPDTVHVLYWDSAVAGHETYNSTNAQDLVQSTKPAGGGGTSPSCITAYMKEKKLEPECVIVLTDGYVGSDWGGSWPCPVLWCIVGGSNIVSPIGKTVHVEDWE